MSEILKPEWVWVDLDIRRVAWPDSKTSGMSKPMSAEAMCLIEAALRLKNSPYVYPAIFDPLRLMSKHTYYFGLVAHLSARWAAAHWHQRNPVSDDPVRAAADALASRRQGPIGLLATATESISAPIIATQRAPELSIAR